MVQNFVRELKDYQARIIATDNNPNELLDNVRWQALPEIERQLSQLQDQQNPKELDKINAKSRQLNQKFEHAAFEQVQKQFQKVIIKAANFIGENSSRNEESQEPTCSWAEESAEGTDSLC